ncbi:F-box/kelch-repeat protein [Ananas comosus]|uniref:F-box/kelch-repeat protein n=1 Tax=Ananas comosus TaxID=4615 RepID=A0A199UJ26_ANACO|nr:F-box/kelch-repeat protein [Ananas comosus]
MLVGICELGVDTGLKTVVGARKFVPGAKLCLQPDIKPNGPRPRNSRRDRYKPKHFLAASPTISPLLA